MAATSEMERENGGTAKAADKKKKQKNKSKNKTQEESGKSMAENAVELASIGDPKPNTKKRKTDAVAEQSDSTFGNKENGPSTAQGNKEVSNTANEPAKKKKKKKKTTNDETKLIAPEQTAALRGNPDDKCPSTEKESSVPKEEEPRHGGNTASDAEPQAKKSKVKTKKRKKESEEQHPTKAVQVNQASIEKAAVGDHQLAATACPIQKCTYQQHSELKSMAQPQIESFRTERKITVEGSSDGLDVDLLRPVTDFKYLQLPAEVMRSVKDFKAPSPVQAQCWPLALQGLDVIGIAATGSGKTLAFGLPLLQHIKTQKEAGQTKKYRGPSAVCMAPTRELAQQITVVLQEAGSACGVSAMAIYGGMKRREQAQQIAKESPGIIVCTPGRLQDFVEDGTISLEAVTFLVLDEADRMLDKGFEDSIRSIVSRIRSDRQTLMFSATWPTAVQKLAMEFLVKPVKVTIGCQELAASHSVTQHVHVIEEMEKNSMLQKLLNKYLGQNKSGKLSGRIIVFVLYKKEAPRVERFINSRGWQAVSVHGDISQEARNQAVEQFTSGEVPVLVATDVAARGLDIPDVTVVINYSFPLTVEDYVHRIGRTGRAGKSGTSHTFFVGKHDKPKAGELVNVLREAGEEIPRELMAFGTAVKKKESKLYGAHFKEVDITQKSKKLKFDSDDE